MCVGEVVRCGWSVRKEAVGKREESEEYMYLGYLGPAGKVIR